MSLTFIWLAVLSMVISIQCIIAQTTLNDLILAKETAVKNVVSSARSFQQGQCSDLTKCGEGQLPCSIPACGTTFPSSSGFHCNATFGTNSALCGGSCSGLTRSLDKSIVRIAPGSQFSLAASANLQAFICNSQRLDTVFKTNMNTGSLAAWQYYGHQSGGIRIYPGAPQGRENGKCSKYDPRIRPWYVAASSGPKDVVLILDTSGSMDRPASPLYPDGDTRLDALKKAVKALLETMTVNDFVGIVQFGTTAGYLGGFTSLVRASSYNIHRLNVAIDDMVPNGDTNMGTAFTKGFNMFTASAENTARCQRMILFLTDGHATDGTAAETAITSGQSTLLTSSVGSKTKAHIFTYSMGSGADDALPKKIACQNDGVWAKISDGEDPLSEMGQYYQFLAAGIDSNTVRWTAPYEDSFGMGQMVTAASPVHHLTFTNDGKTHRVLMGVVGTDILMSELSKFGDQVSTVVGALTTRSAVCPSLTLTPCQMQFLREPTGYVCEYDASNPAAFPTLSSCSAASDTVKPPTCTTPLDSVNNVLCEALNPLTGVSQTNPTVTTKTVTCCSSSEGATCSSNAGGNNGNNGNATSNEEESSGASVGVIVGVVVVVVVIVGGIAGFLVFRKRTTSGASGATSNSALAGPEDATHHERRGSMRRASMKRDPTPVPQPIPQAQPVAVQPQPSHGYYNQPQPSQQYPPPPPAQGVPIYGAPTSQQNGPIRPLGT